MTVSATPLKEFNVGQICTLAWRSTGLVNLYQQPSTEQMSWATDLLTMIVDELDTEGLFAKAVGFEYLTLQTGVFQYNFSTACIDVVDDGMFIPAGQPLNGAAGEFQVRLVAQQEWAQISSKDAQGTPVLLWPNRVGTLIQGTIWPTPTAFENGGSIRIPCHRLRQGMTDQTATPDFERWWAPAFQWELAHQLAVGSSLPLDKCNYLAMTARQKIDRARGKSNSRADIQIRLSHPTSFRAFHR